MLIRKHDWHDYDGAKYLLDHGAGTNGPRKRGWRPLHHALARSNRLAIIELLLDHGADPMLTNERDGRSKAQACDFHLVTKRLTISSAATAPR